MTELAYINGKILPIKDAVVSIEDRGYQFGDAVYEFIASYDGKMFWLEAHLDRLIRSMSELSFPVISRSFLKDEIYRLYDKADISRAGIYIQISRGIAKRNHAFGNKMVPQLVMTIRPVSEVSPALKENGVKVITMEDFRWGRCDIKTVQLLPNVLAKQKAVKAGVYDTIFISREKIVREASSSNLFAVIGNKIFTHPLTRHILEGITRKVIFEICGRLNYEIEERFFDLDLLYGAKEVFLSGTVTEILPVIKIDDKFVGKGQPGPKARAIFKALRACTKDS